MKVIVTMLDFFLVPKTYCKDFEIKSDKTQISKDKEKYLTGIKAKKGF